MNDAQRELPGYTFRQETCHSMFGLTGADPRSKAADVCPATYPVPCHVPFSRLQNLPVDLWYTLLANNSHDLSATSSRRLAA
jgi:hypothetical protein